jgi:hypothetical protein
VLDGLSKGAGVSECRGLHSNVAVECKKNEKNVNR